MGNERVSWLREKEVILRRMFGRLNYIHSQVDGWSRLFAQFSGELKEMRVELQKELDKVLKEIKEVG